MASKHNVLANLGTSWPESTKSTNKTRQLPTKLLTKDTQYLLIGWLKVYCPTSEECCRPSARCDHILPQRTVPLLALLVTINHRAMNPDLPSWLQRQRTPGRSLPLRKGGKERGIKVLVLSHMLVYQFHMTIYSWYIQHLTNNGKIRNHSFSM